MKASKTIYINGKFLFQETTGVQRYSTQLLLYLDAYLSITSLGEHQVVLVVPEVLKNSIIKLTNIKVRVWSVSKNLQIWEQLLPILTFRHFLLNFSGSAPLFKVKQVSTIHDAAIYERPDGYTKIFIYWYRLLFFVQSYFSIAVITVSHNSRSRLVNYLPRLKNKIGIVPNTADHFVGVEADCSILAKLGLQEKNFYLCVANFNPTKNLTRLLDAYQSISSTCKVSLVVVGSPNPRVFSDNLVDKSKNLDGVVWAGRVSDPELKALYMHALCFVFPSTYEGFGIPLLEAMHCSCPVLCSELPIMYEVCEDAAYYFNPFSAKSIAESLVLASTSPDQLLLMKDAAFKRAEYYSGRNVIKSLINLLQGALFRRTTP